jgi:hypothetical protein
MASMQMLNSKPAVQLRGSGQGRRQQVLLRAAARQADSLQLAVSTVGSRDVTLYGSTLQGLPYLHLLLDASAAELATLTPST